MNKHTLNDAFSAVALFFATGDLRGSAAVTRYERMQLKRLVASAKVNSEIARCGSRVRFITTHLRETDREAVRQRQRNGNVIVNHASDAT